MVRKPDLTRWHRININESEDIAAKIEELKRIPGIEVVEPDFVRKPTAISLPQTGADPLAGQQWHLNAINAPQAWAHLLSVNLPPGGSHDVVVAVIDTGIDMTHPDLAASLWTNSTNNTHGRNVVTDTDNPTDDNGHGTHVAGIIAAQANNGAGGVGIAYNVQIMAIKAAQYSGILSTSDIAEGIYYAVSKGADIINMSFGGYGKSTIEEDALTTAFGQAVLIAAAGNDGISNDYACDGKKAKVMYPAGYNWVVGVMASNQYSSGGYLSSFSNYDCIPNDSNEYEIMAPGAGIMSTLPNNQYAAWSGTSMATPVVSGIAALVRTKFPDKSTYSSRFIMGQLITTGGTRLAYTPQKGDPVYFSVPDAYAALTTTPAPKLSYLNSILFDTTSQSALNNNNGRIDAGETIDLAVTVQNKWGKADYVSIKLEALAAGAATSDPYITMIADTVNYGAIGSFNSDDNGITRDAAGTVTGVTNPFRFSVNSATPNGHVIPFKVTMTAKNGFDANDTASYETVSYFTITVTNGTELPRIISQNMTLSKDTLWIVPDATLIEAGVTVTISEGAKVQFYSSAAKAPYALDPLASLTVKGTLNVIGSVDSPVEMTLASQYSGRVISIQKQDSGIVNLEYVKVQNPSFSVSTIKHSEFMGTGTYTFTEVVNGSTIMFWLMHYVVATDIRSSRFISLGPDLGVNPASSSGIFTVYSFKMNNNQDSSTVNSSIDGSLFSNNVMTLKWPSTSPSFTNNTVLNNSRSMVLNGSTTWRRSYFFFENHLTCAQQTAQVSNNAFLERYINPDPNAWTSFRYENSTLSQVQKLPANDFCMPNNYWGTTSTPIINALTYDYNDDFSLGRLVNQPILTTASETAYPFVTNVAISKDGAPTAVIGAGSATMTVTFNRDMDATVLPQVSFGPATPYTDFMVRGDWTDARTWTGSFIISPITGDGYQIVRVAGARAASDHWLVTGDDSGRFQFQILTSGTESMNLQASGGEGHVNLTWSQNDFDLLGGYHLYRSTTAGGTYTRINATIIPPQTKAYSDLNVTPGQAYFYKFTVSKTDSTESAFSNVATGTPLDTIPPVITHTKITTATTGLPLSVTATITDNVAVTGATLYFRTTGTSSYTSQAMTKTTGNSYSSVIIGSQVVAPGIEYYLTATDGIITVYAGNSNTPNPVAVSDNPVITSVSPTKGPAAGGTAVTISGTNFKTGATVTFGGSAADNVVVVSSNQITCVTPVHFSVSSDVIVTNPDSKNASLLRGYTFESDTASVSMSAYIDARNAVIQVPVNAANVSGLVAADITITFDSTVIRPRTVSKGTLTSAWSFASNTATSGQISISMTSIGSVTGSGSLVNLEFDVIGAPGTTTAMTLSSVRLNGGAIPVLTTNGSVTVQSVYSISGTAVHWKNSTSIPTVQFELNGDRLYTAQSDSGGSYSVTGVLPGSYTLRPSKTGDTLGITAYDASLVLQHAAKIITLTGSAAIAADVDKSGTIDSYDAYQILQKAAELISLPFQGAGVTWDFTPASRVYANLNTNLSAQNFTGVLLGDVSGNWSATGASIEGGSPIIFDVSETAPAADQTLTATVSINPQTEAINSLDMILTYDQTKGLPVDVQTGAAVPGWLLGYNLTRAGEIRVALAGSTPITATGSLLNIRFNINRGSQNVLLRVASSSANEIVTMNAYRYLLGLIFSGTGGGSVSGGMSCYSGGSCNPLAVNQGENITLMPTPDTNSHFSGWSDNCLVNNNNCSVTVDSVKKITATFTEADKVRTGKMSLTSMTAHAKLSEAFSQVQPDELIQARAIEFVESLVISRYTKFKGGFNADFNDSGRSYTVLKGTLKIGAGGKLIVERLVIKP